MSKPTPTPPALVLGTGLTVLGVVRSLARAGISALCVSADADFESKSRWYRPHRELLDAWATASDLSALLERSGLAGGVLIACSDHWAVEVTRLTPEMTSRFRACAPETDVIVSLIDKARFCDHLRRAGVPHPFTEPVTSESRLAELMATAPAGAFLKPADSQRFLALFGRKAVRVADTTEAAEWYRRAREHGIDLILQEYISGGADRHYFVDGFVDRNHRVVASFARRRQRMHPPDFGNSSCVISVPPSAVSPALDALSGLFAAARYRGVFSAEFKHDPHDDLFKLLEVNCRPWWYVEFCQRCGVNVVEMAYRDCLDGEYPRPGRYREGVELVYTYYDIHACRRMVQEGSMTALGCARSWIGGMKAIFTWDDPYPAVWNFLGRVRRWVASRMRGGAGGAA